MTTLRRGSERFHEQGPDGEIWHTFHPHDRSDPLAEGFGPLASLSEERVAMRSLSSKETESPAAERPASAASRGVRSR